MVQMDGSTSDEQPMLSPDPVDKAFRGRHALSFCGGVLAMLVSGTLYSWSAFAQAIEGQLKISAVDAGWVVKVGNIGLCIGLTAGAAADHLGLRATALLGGLLGGGGFLLMWAHVKGLIGGGVAAMSVFYFIAGQGCIFTYMPGLMNYKNISPKLHGVSLGILDMSFGLSSVIFSQIYAQTFGSNADPLQQNLSGFILFLACSMIAVSIVNLIVLHVPSHGRQTPQVEVEETGYPNAESDAAVMPMSAALVSFEFQLLFIFFVLNQGATVWYIGAVSDMATSFGMGGHGATLTTIMTATGAVCRIGGGVLSDLLHRFISRITFLLALSLLLPVGFILLIALPMGSFTLTVGSVLVGAGFGGAWCLVPLVVSDTFGLQNFSTIWGIVIIGSAIGPFILQPIDSAVQGAHSPATGDHCSGVQCYWTTYVACLAICCLASALVLLLAYRLAAKKKGQESRTAYPEAREVCPA